MEIIEQKIAEPIIIVSRSEVIYIEQTDAHLELHDTTDVIQVEKQSIPALIGALKKYAE